MSFQSAQSLLIKAFNKHFFEFIDDIIRICPEDNGINVSKEYLLTIKSANPTLLLKIWYQFICEPYNNEINEGNLNFFFEKDYKHDLRMLSNSKDILKVIDSTIRDPLRNMDEVNYDKCRKHFQLVSMICTKYIDQK